MHFFEFCILRLLVKECTKGYVVGWLPGKQPARWKLIGRQFTKECSWNWGGSGLLSEAGLQNWHANDSPVLVSVSDTEWAFNVVSSWEKRVGLQTSILITQWMKAIPGRGHHSEQDGFHHVYLNEASSWEQPPFLDCNLGDAWHSALLKIV
jgi:hypothetical protein